MKDLISRVQQRSKQYRPLPFWSWNDKLKTDMTAWQIREMAKTGHGGYFMHARGGIQTDYLSDEWFEQVEVGIKEGLANDLDPWLYDESGWPSGFAGGEVTAKGKAFHAKGLFIDYIDQIDAYEKDENFLNFYEIDASTKEIRVITEDTTNPMVAIKYTVCSDYIDILNHEVTEYFIECTHEKYYEKFKDEFGRGIKGFFTDEPRISEGDVPWSHLLPDEFKKRYDYDLLDHLPALFMETKDYEKVRYDFWAVISDLFVTAFMKQLYDWCEEHDTELTGHVMMEESLYSQMTGTAGSMPFYEYMHVPGVDWLRRTMGNSIMTKQVGSAAEQLGRTRVLTESYALSGWDVSLEELKWMAEWQYVNGVNMMCQHLAAYTLRGFRKRDYPPSVFIQQNWWEEYKDFNDYLSNLGALLSDGEKIVDVLVIHPMKSAWIAFDGKNNDVISKLDSDLIDLTDKLLGSHVDYHFGDETLMKNHGSLANGKLQIGKCEYGTVILPSLLSLDENTVDLLEEFVANGGKLISIGDYPALCNGRPSSRLENLKEQTDVFDTAEMFLKETTNRAVSITMDNQQVSDIRYTQREVEEGKLLFMINLSKEEFYDTKVRVEGKFGASLISLEDMSEMEYPTVVEGNQTSFDIRFAPMQSYSLVLKEEIVEQEKEEIVADVIKVDTGSWDVEKSYQNTLTLDKCKYRIDQGKWQEELPVIHIMKKLLEMRKPCDIELNFTFNVQMDPEKMEELYLIAEEAGDYDITINGTKVAYTGNEWWKDTSFKKLDIRDYIVKGENNIHMARKFYQSPNVYRVLFGEGVYETELNQLTYDVELESIYLLGDFGVVSESGYTELPKNGIRTAGPFALVEKPKVLQVGDFTRQGLCFFSGKLDLTREIQISKKSGNKIMLDFGRVRTPLFKLYVNNKLVSKFMWEPFQADITSYVQEGANEIRVEMYSSNRNLLGPHHHIDGEVYNVGPASFAGEWSWVERPTEGVPIDRSKVTQSYWNDDYCFVTFGL